MESLRRLSKKTLSGALFWSNRKESCLTLVRLRFYEKAKGGVFSFRGKIAWSSLFSAAVVFPPLFYLIIILCFCQIELVKNLGSKKGKRNILYLKIIIKIKFDPWSKPDPIFL